MNWPLLEYTKLFQEENSAPKHINWLELTFWGERTNVLPHPGPFLVQTAGACFLAHVANKPMLTGLQVRLVSNSTGGAKAIPAQREQTWSGKMRTCY